MECAMINKDECMNTQKEILLQHWNKIHYLYRFNVINENLKNIKPLNIIAPKFDNALYFVELIDNKPKIIADILLREIDHQLKFFDYYKKIVITTKIRITLIRNTKLLFIAITIVIRSQIPENYDLSIEDLVYQGGGTKMVGDKPYSRYKIPIIGNSRCDEKYLHYCINFFPIYFPFKNNNQQIITKDDIYLNHYYLNGDITKDGVPVEIIRKYENTSIDDSSDFPEIDSQKFTLTSRNIASCKHINEQGLLNIECVCQQGHFGLDCSQQYFCSNCEKNKCSANNECSLCRKGFKDEGCLKTYSENLDICGKHGTRNTDYPNICVCQEGWGGKYCTKLLPKPLETTTSEELTKISSTPNATTNPQSEDKSKAEKSSKNKIVIGITVSLIVLISIIVAVIFFIKNKG